MTAEPIRSLTNPTSEEILTAAFDRLRPDLIAMIQQRITDKKAVRVDPEGVVREAYERAVPRWLAQSNTSESLDKWISGQVLDRLTELTHPTKAILAAAFDRLRPRLLAMIQRRINHKAAVRIDPEEVVHEAYLRAVPRWLAESNTSEPLDGWIFGQVLDRLTELMRAAFGPTRNIDREQVWTEGSAAELVKKLFNVGDRPSAAISREELSQVLQIALQKLDPIDRKILTFRFFDDMSFPEILTILNREPNTNLEANTANQRAVRALLKLRKLIPPAFRPPGQSSS